MSTKAAVSNRVEVAVVGAGLGGIAAGCKLLEAGQDSFVILDKNPAVGGVWHENNYPGCSCDVAIALYQFSFAPSGAWNYLFPRSKEVQAYAEEVVQNFGLGPKLRLGEAVESARWDEAAGHWVLATSKGEEVLARSMVAAMGQLNRPRWPDIPGLDDFAGDKVHSARWRDDVALDGRVGVVGSAASAVQLIPEVAEKAEQLVVFQRSPNWVEPRADREITPEEKALMATDLEAAMRIGEMNRQLIYEGADHFFWKTFSWTEEGRAAHTRLAMDHLHAQVPDAELRAKLTPDYPIGCRRILFTDDFYPALMRENVHLETAPIAGADAAGLTLQGGGRHDLDTLVFATGFETTGWNWSMDVQGQGGVHLGEAWRERPQAYLGITVHGFPNMFVLYGPNTNLGHNSITFMLERQVEYVVAALGNLGASNARGIMPKREVQESFNRKVQEQLGGTVWADPACNSWYKNDAGVVTQNWSSHTRDYAAAVADFAPDDYEYLV